MRREEKKGRVDMKEDEKRMWRKEQERRYKQSRKRKKNEYFDDFALRKQTNKQTNGSGSSGIDTTLP